MYLLYASKEVLIMSYGITFIIPNSLRTKIAYIQNWV